MEELKQEAIERLRIIGLDSQIIKEFAENNKVYVTRINDKGTEFIFDSKIMDMIKIFEKEKTIKIYHVIIYENDLYILSVHKHKENWNKEKVELKRGFVTIVLCNIIDGGIVELIARDIGIEIETGKIQRVVYGK
ncbi:MAG: hypothetical protein HFJ35_04140 [Clostridia bacterium]|nr:hypothetical protein [Clostridia bacterium]